MKAGEVVVFRCFHKLLDMTPRNRTSYQRQQLFTEDADSTLVTRLNARNAKLGFSLTNYPSGEQTELSSPAHSLILP